MSENPEQPAKSGGRRKKLLLIALPVGLALAGAGAWFGGLFGGHHAPAGEPAAEAAASRAPVYFDMPEIVANLNVTGRRSSYVKLRSKLEVTRAEDVPALQAAMPRLLDLFTTYLREMRPDELRGSLGTQRLREELTARANLAAPPARVTDVLFLEMLQQ